MADMNTILARERIRQISSRFEGMAEYKTPDGNVRHKCFLSYHAEDAQEVLGFVNAFESVFIPRSVGISEEEDWIDSDDDDYVMNTIRDDYLADSTVTLVMIGKCTWARKFIDWEVYSSLRQDKINRVNGLLAIQLPSGGNATLPARVQENVVRDSNGRDTGYARYNSYPSSSAALQIQIQDAFDSRNTRRALIDLGGARKKYNSSC